MTVTMDDGTGGALYFYLETARPVQEGFKQVLTQLAGCSLLVMTRSGPATRPDAAMRLARAAADNAHEQLRALRVPAEAAHHFHHLRQLSEAIGWAFRALGSCTEPQASDADRDELTLALKTATRHLRATAAILPGFETVDFGQACCAVHHAAGLTVQAG